MAITLSRELCIICQNNNVDGSVVLGSCIHKVCTNCFVRDFGSLGRQICPICFEKVDDTIHYQGGYLKIRQTKQNDHCFGCQEPILEGETFKLCSHIPQSNACAYCLECYYGFGMIKLEKTVCECNNNSENPSPFLTPKVMKNKIMKYDCCKNDESMDVKVSNLKRNKEIVDTCKKSDNLITDNLGKKEEVNDFIMDRIIVAEKNEDKKDDKKGKSFREFLHEWKNTEKREQSSIVFDDIENDISDNLVERNLCMEEKRNDISDDIISSAGNLSDNISDNIILNTEINNKNDKKCDEFERFLINLSQANNQDDDDVLSEIWFNHDEQFKFSELTESKTIKREMKQKRKKDDFKNDLSSIQLTENSNNRSSIQSLSGSEELNIDNNNNVKIDGRKKKFFFNLSRSAPSISSTEEISDSENVTPPVLLSRNRKRCKLTDSSKKYSNEKKRRRLNMKRTRRRIMEKEIKKQGFCLNREL